MRKGLFMINTTGQGNTNKRPEQVSAGRQREQNGRNSQPVQKKANKHAIGTCAEERAAQFLQARGLRILARNYRCRQGEIDLIAWDGRYLIFAEVKYRSSSRCADPLSAVNGAKQKKICRVADYFRFTQKVPDDVPVRYDVIGILGEKTAWIPNAFPHQPGT